MLSDDGGYVAHLVLSIYNNRVYVCLRVLRCVCSSLPVDTSGSVHQIGEFCSLVFCLENPQKHTLNANRQTSTHMRRGSVLGRNMMTTLSIPWLSTRNGVRNKLYADGAHPFAE